jgi:hypothetical protein
VIGFVEKRAPLRELSEHLPQLRPHIRVGDRIGIGQFDPGGDELLESSGRWTVLEQRHLARELLLVAIVGATA